MGGEGGGSALLPPHRTPPSSPHHNAPPVRTAHLGRVEVGGVIFIGAFAFALRGDEGGGQSEGGGRCVHGVPVSSTGVPG